jgi:hypothetical protein
MPGGLAFVARRAAAHHAASASYTIAVSGVSTNSLLVLCFGVGNGANCALTSVSDNGTGSAWQIDTGINASSTQDGCFIASTLVGSGPPTLLTVNLSSSFCQSSYMVGEFTGVIAEPNWLDASASAKVGLGFPMNSPSITPTNTGELLVAAFNINTGQSGFTAGTDSKGGTCVTFGAPQNATPDICCEYLLGCPAGTQTVSGTIVASPPTTIAACIALYDTGAAVLSEIAILQAVNRAATY